MDLFFNFSWALNISGTSWPDQTEPTQTSPDQIQPPGTGFDRLAGTNGVIWRLLLCITKRYHTIIVISMVQSGLARWELVHNNHPFLPPFFHSFHRSSEGIEGRSIYGIRWNKTYDWSTNSTALPTRHHPQASYWSPTSFSKEKLQTASPSPIGHHSLRQERLFIPIGQFW